MKRASDAKAEIIAAKDQGMRRETLVVGTPSDGFPPDVAVTREEIALRA